MSQRTGTTKIGYVKKTNLSDDFRTLLIPKQKTKPKLVANYCPICLKKFIDPKSLPCFHTFCLRCLQYAIDKEPWNSDQDRGFMCILCGYFVRVPDYSLPRLKWAEQIEDDFTKHAEDDHLGPGDDNGTPIDLTTSTIPDKDIMKEWILEWQLSTYSKSYFNARGLDPYKRTKKGFPYIRQLAVSDEQEYSAPGHHNDTTGDINCNNQKINDDLEERDEQSDVIAVTQYGDNVVVYDRGLSEILVYNTDLTIKSSLSNSKIFGLAVLDDLLYMTNPADLCIEVVDLFTMERKPSINITMKCFGITSLFTELAVLLWNVNDQDLHICFLDNCCVTGGYISLKAGDFEFKNPRNLAGCPSTRLLYVSDSEAGLLKCFRPNGELKWEKIVYGAGNITVFNCYIIVARRFTHSVDVLSEGGCFIGRLQSEDYGLISPNVISANTDTKTLVISDHDHMMHVFNVKTRIKNSTNLQPKVSLCDSCLCVMS